jgi:VanZ family protein
MLPRLSNLVLYWLPLIAYCALIYIQSAYPPPGKLPSFFLADKIVHCGLYAVLGILFYRAYKTLPIARHHRILMLLSIASASLYGISDEIHQHFVPFREADIFDAVADAIGAAGGVFFYHFWLTRRKVGPQPKIS